jgi:hypothetical protein
VADTSFDCAPNITKGRVTFGTSSSGNPPFTPITGAANLPVGPITPGNLRVGTASSTVQYNIGNNNTITLFVGISVGGDYGLPATEVHPICISRPVTGQITGCGKLDNIGAVGMLPGLVAGVGYSETAVGVTYNKSGANPQGSICVIVYVGGGKSYRLKSNAISTFAVNGKTSNFSAKCSITDELGNSIDGGALMQIAITDNSTSNGLLDTLAVSVQNQKTGGLWFGSKWDTTQGKVVQKNLTGGNVSAK